VIPSPFDQRNGWNLYQHPAFRIPFDALTAEVERLSKKHPETYISYPKTKLLARITALILDEIPIDPTSPQFLLGNTLNPQHRHWRRAKFLQRFRLFFRFDSQQKIIIYAWVNDEESLRKAGAKTDVYNTFEKRLKAGNPPDDWDNLLEETQ